MTSVFPVYSSCWSPQWRQMCLGFQETAVVSFMLRGRRETSISHLYSCCYSLQDTHPILTVFNLPLHHVINGQGHVTDCTEQAGAAGQPLAHWLWCCQLPRRREWIMILCVFIVYGCILIEAIILQVEGKRCTNAGAQRWSDWSTIQR